MFRDCEDRVIYNRTLDNLLSRACCPSQGFQDNWDSGGNSVTLSEICFTCERVGCFRCRQSRLSVSGRPGDRRPEEHRKQGADEHRSLHGLSDRRLPSQHTVVTALSAYSGDSIGVSI